jgi:hypothetical protein
MVIQDLGQFTSPPCSLATIPGNLKCTVIGVSSFTHSLHVTKETRILGGKAFLFVILQHKKTKKKSHKRPRYPRQFTNTHPATTLAMDPKELLSMERATDFPPDQNQAEEDGDIVVQWRANGEGQKGERKNQDAPHCPKNHQLIFCRFVSKKEGFGRVGYLALVT